MNWPKNMKQQNQNASGNIENHSSDDQKTKFKRAFDTALIINNQSIDSVMYDVMILGNKTLELLKCLVLINMWYNTPEMYHHQKLISLHICVLQWHLTWVLVAILSVLQLLDYQRNKIQTLPKWIFKV